MFTENTGERFFSRRFFCEETFKTLGVETLSDALDYSLRQWYKKRRAREVDASMSPMRRSALALRR